MAEWERALRTTIADYVRGEEINVMRNRKWLALLMDRGRITFNHEGLKLHWKTRYREAPINGYGDGQTLVFARQNRHKDAELDWRGYYAADSITKKERLMNRGKAAIVKVFSELPQILMQEMKNQFSTELYKDGNASGNELLIHGIESFMGDDGSVSTTQPITDASDTYAGLSTVLGNYGGTWTGNWPEGTGDAAYDFWSPLLIDYESAVAATSGGWSSSTKTWPNTCTEAIAYAVLYGQKNRGMDDQLDLICLEARLFREYKEANRGKERIQVNSASKLVKLGFNDVINQDGIDITTEYGVPATVGYGLNMDQMELMSLQPTLFVPTGPIYDEDTKSWKFDLDFLGNAQFNPRSFVKFDDYT